MPRRDGIAPLLISIAVAAAGVAVMIWLSLRQTGGQLVYTLDDPYIHLSIAATLARSGTWGCNPGEFAGASSSPLWTLLLAGAFRVTEIRADLALFANLVTALLLMICAWRVWRPVLPCRWISGGLLLMPVVVCLPTLVLVGMEHVLHAALAVALTASIAARASQPHGTRVSVGQLVGLALLAILAAACRFESGFLIAGGALVFLIRRQWLCLITLCVAGIAPVIAYAGFSISHGGAWLPNSVLLKAAVPGHEGLATLLRSIPAKLPRAPHLFALLAAAGAGLWALRRETTQIAGACRAMLLIFIVATLLHLQFAQTGWMYRYEAYLIAVGWVAVVAAVAILFRGAVQLTRWMRCGVCTLLGIATCLLLVRCALAVRQTPGACRNVHDQHLQMAAFVADTYAGQSVAVHDIGAVSFYADGKTYVLDLWGLASTEVFRLQWARGYGRAAIAALVRQHDAQVVIIYPHALEQFGGVPPEWQCVEQWVTPQMELKTGDTIGFYAPRPELKAALRANLERFAPRLAPGVARRKL